MHVSETSKKIKIIITLIELFFSKKKNIVDVKEQSAMRRKGGKPFLFVRRLCIIVHIRKNFSGGWLGRFKNTLI
jgi:hypothetical protein